MIRRDPEYKYVWIDNQPEPGLTLPQQLDRLQSVGNAHGDADIFGIAHLILIGDFDMSDKLKALRKIDLAMGESGEISEHAVEAYCRIWEEDNGQA